MAKRLPGVGVAAGGTAVGALKAHADTLRTATHETLRAMGRDPSDPTSYARLTAEQRHRIGMRAGVALLASGASSALAKQATRELNAVPMPERGQMVTEELLDRTIQSALEGISKSSPHSN